MTTINVHRNPSNPTEYLFQIMNVRLEPYVGCQAGPMRVEGFKIKDTVPDCAVLKDGENGLFWGWVNATFTIKVEM